MWIPSDHRRVGASHPLVSPRFSRFFQIVDDVFEDVFAETVFEDVVETVFEDVIIIIIVVVVVPRAPPRLFVDPWTAVSSAGAIPFSEATVPCAPSRWSRSPRAPW